METLVKSLEFMPDVHIAMTSNRQSWYLDHLNDCAEKIGARERLHFIPYVEPEEVVSYLSAATIGISPLPADVVNYDLALPNKLFDYMQAKLPIVVSNCVVAEQVVTELGIGEVFEWSSAQSLSEAVQKVIADPTKYAQAYATKELEVAKYTWRAQEHLLLETYFSLQAD
jgi:glycosyltransferase involved in cell wall biosynthesis